jgi:hypothetical protein
VATEGYTIASSRQKYYHDRGLKPRSYTTGDWVWRWYPPRAGLKLGLGWTGPYLVLVKVSSLTYKIQLDEHRRPLVAHVDHLKPYEGDDAPRNWTLIRADSVEELAVSLDDDRVEIEEPASVVDGVGSSDNSSDTESEEVDILGSPDHRGHGVQTRTGRTIRPPVKYSP